jgi:hypothetical protein
MTTPATGAPAPTPAPPPPRPLTNLTIDDAESLLRHQSPMHVASVFELAARRLATQVKRYADKQALRTTAKHFSHVTMAWVPEEVAAGRAGGGQ